MSARILVVDDEQDVLNFVVPMLEDAGYEVITASDGVEALAKWRDEFPDLIVLDIRMPGMSGLDVLREVRRDDDVIPVVMLTALDESYEQKRAIKQGANQFIGKSEQDLLRDWVGSELQQLRQSTLECTSVKIDYSAMQVYKRHEDEWQEQHLEPNERRLLFFLARRHGKAQSYEILNRRALGKHSDEGRTGLNKHISTLRNKIEPTRKKPKYIHTVPGYGYRFDC
jgi:DNA-binding response OmpR family regulator